MIKELTMDEALEVMGGDPFNDSGSSLLNWNPLPNVQPAFTALSPSAPLQSSPSWNGPSDSFSCAGALLATGIAAVQFVQTGSLSNLGYQTAGIFSSFGACR